jgi:mannose-6-phosphate isomerase-like protein (cupin superfamily)
MEKVNLREKFSRFHDHWSPKIVGDLNDSHVKLVKFQGTFVWHRHEHEDEMFLVIAGEMQVRLRDRVISLGAGEFFIVPKGVEHMTAADSEAQVLLLEPKTTVNTGNVTNERTVARPERI